MNRINRVFIAKGLVYSGVSTRKTRDKLRLHSHGTGRIFEPRLGVLLMSCTVNFHVVRSALQN